MIQSINQSLPILMKFFGQVQRLMFIVVKFWSSSNVRVRCCKFFWSNSNQFSVILIRSSKLASYILNLYNILMMLIKSKNSMLLSRSDY